MGKPRVQEHTERRIAATLRLALAALLLAAQIAVTVLLSVVLRQHAAIAYTVLELSALAVAIWIYNRPGSSSYKMGWIVLIVLAPVTGAILFFLWSGDRQSKRLNMRDIPMPKESELREELSRSNVEKLRARDAEWGRLAAYLHRQGFPLYQHTQAAYFPSGEKYLDDVLERMEKAEHFILAELFIMATGEMWNTAVEILHRKASQGVEVKLLFDDFGSMMRMSKEEVERLRTMGIEVKVFNPVHQYVNRLYFNYRDHRKIICIDGDVVYTGGVNLGDEYANIVQKFGYWKDSGIRLEGEGAWGLTREFIHMWEKIGGQMDREHDYYRPHSRPESEGYCQSVSDGPNNNPVSTVEDVYLQMITGANKEVYITTPYLAIDEPMIKALCLAGDSGVDVYIIVPGIPDKKYAYLVAECYFGELMTHGVKIFRFTPGFIHSKSVMSDRQVAFVGSVNMDFRSFDLHFECGTVLYDVPAIRELAADLHQTIAQCEEVTMEQWRHRPWLRKGVGVLLRLFAMWM